MGVDVAIRAWNSHDHGETSPNENIIAEKKLLYFRSKKLDIYSLKIILLLIILHLD